MELTLKQMIDAHSRAANGESINSVAKAFGISKEELKKNLERVQGLPEVWDVPIIPIRRGGALEIREVGRYSEKFDKDDHCHHPVNETFYPATGYTVMVENYVECGFSEDTKGTTGKIFVWWNTYGKKPSGPLIAVCGDKRCVKPTHMRVSGEHKDNSQTQFEESSIDIAKVLKASTEEKDVEKAF